MCIKVTLLEKRHRPALPFISVFYKRFSETPFRTQTIDSGFPTTQSVLNVLTNKKNWNNVSD